MPHGSAIPAAGSAPAPRGILRAELGATVKLALPMALTQLGQTAMLTTDVLLVGRLGAGVLPYLYLPLGVISLIAALAYGAALGRARRGRLFIGILVGVGIVYEVLKGWCTRQAVAAAAPSLPEIPAEIREKIERELRELG